MTVTNKGQRDENHPNRKADRKDFPNLTEAQFMQAQENPEAFSQQYPLKLSSKWFKQS